MLNTPKLSDAKRALLEKYMQGNRSQSTILTPSLPRRTTDGNAPLSYGQQQLWLLDQLVPDAPVYNECVTIHLPGTLNVVALERSLNEFIRRHEIWRTSFQVVDGEPVQVVHPPFSLQLHTIDLRHLPGVEREAEAVRIVLEKASVPFDLSTIPLLRPTLIRFDNEEYRLFLTLHHIIFDGVAIYQVFPPELRTLYEAFVAGKPSPLPELPIQYSDYAQWQREYIQGDAIAKQLAYWKQQLAEAPTSLELPIDHPRPPLDTHRGSMRPFALSRQLTDALKTLSNKESVTLYMVMVAAFQTLLYRYTGQEDMLLGTVTAGRKHAEVQKMMGFFLNTLVLRTDISGNPTFHALLPRVREVVLEALANPDVPFEYLVKELQPERNLGQNPLFQALITLEPPLPILPSGWTLTQMDVRVGTAKFDLYLELDDRPEGLIGRFMYNTDLFDEATIERMTGHWQALLAAIVDDPGLHISDLPILTPQEQRQILVEWNATQTSYPDNKYVHSLFEEQVQQQPEAIALIFENQCMTYMELNQRANQLAHYLRRLGVSPETLVGLCMHRSFDLVVALLGIMKAGGAYVPLDPNFPKERLAFMLEDMQAPLIITQQELVAFLPTTPTATKLLCLDTAREQIADEESTNPVCNVSPDNMIYTIYTSGSTGRPKGVMNTHRGLFNRLYWMMQEYQLTATDRVLQKTPFTFDVSFWEMFWPLLTGATLVVAKPGGHQDASYIAALIAEHSITTAHFVPSMLQMFLQEPNLESSTKSLKQVICSGEALPFELQEKFFAHIDAELYNLYGPTEASIEVTYWRCQRESQQRIVPIGHPIANTQMYLLDSSMRPVPIGVSGELYIGGVGVARGYLNRVELTQERFVADPFSTQPNARLYRTGDLARYRPDGAIEYLGRIDHQVKIRGLRIELGEIETILLQHPAVRDAVLVAREDNPGDQRLIAYVIPTSSQSSLAIEPLRAYLKEQLPAYMVPSSFVSLDTFPLLSNGKIHRQALPAPSSVRSIDEGNFVAPTQVMHYQLLSIWEELLQVRPIGIQDNFFDLGGHSLLAVRLVARIEQMCGKRLSLAMLFAGPTIEQVTNILQGEMPQPKKAVVMVQGGGSKQPFFFLHGDTTGGAFYCFPMARHMGPEQPFYVLEPYQFNDMQGLLSIEEIATTHIKALREVQPEGPYLLGGFCNGSLIAYEMFRQLHAQGQRVDLLVLVDPIILPRFRKVHKLMGRIGNLLHLSNEKQLNMFLRLRHLYLCILQRKALQDSEGREVYDPELSTIFPTNKALHKDYPGVLAWLTSRYELMPYAGKTTILWAKEERFRGIWKQKVKQEKIELHFIPGTHITCRTDYLPSLAEQVRKCLYEAQKAL